MSGLHHSCSSCGGSCQGVRVRLVSEAESLRVEQLGESLSVLSPISLGQLRQTDEGRCVFLNSQQLCSIHAQFGAAEKPVICRQYPVVLVSTESGRREGIDPGCYSAYATQRGEDSVLVTSEMVCSEVVLEAPLAYMEQVLLGLLTLPNQSVEGALGRLAGLDGSGLPPGFSERLIELLAGAEIQRACTHPSAGPSVRSGLAPIMAGLSEWAEHGPPSKDWPEGSQEWGLEVARRMVWLRLCPQMPSPMVVSLLSLCGALVAGWSAAKDPQSFAVILAAWSRAMRSQLFWGSLLPDSVAMRRLMRG